MYKKSLLPLFIFVSIVIGFLFGKFLYQSDNIFYAQNEDFQKLRGIIELIEDNYSDDIDVFDFLHESLLRKLSIIDPYSYYLDDEEQEKAAMDNSGIFHGLGISYTSYFDTITVLDVYENSPAEEAGIKTFDKILSINGIDLIGVSQDSVASLFSAKKKFKIEFQNFFSKNISTVKVKKDDIPLNSIVFSRINDNVGYIKIERFSLNTYDFFVEAAEELLADGLEYLILDLRNNPGGILTTSVEILDEFFATEDTLVVTKTNDENEEVFYSTKKALLADVQLIVLINNNSASASELVSVVLQDYDRALFMGGQTYGKGVFQQNLRSVNNDFLHVTTGKYFGPSGRWIDSRGVTSTDEKKYFKTKNGRYVSENTGILPEIFYFGYDMLSFVEMLDSYVFEIIINNEELFIDDINYSNIDKIAESIADTSRIFEDYFGSIDPLKLAFAKLLIDEDVYLTHLLAADTLVLQAIDIIDKDLIEEKIYENDTVKKPLDMWDF